MSAGRSRVGSSSRSRRARGAVTAMLWTCAALAVTGLAVAVYRLAAGLGASTNLSDAYPWGLWIGIDFTLIAFSGGAFTLAAMVHVFDLERYRPILRTALLTGWLGYLCVLVILIFDLGRPDRFWGFLVYPNALSPLYEVSWCVLLYSVVLTLEFLPAFLERARTPRALAVLGRIQIPLAILGVTLSAVHQSSLGTVFLALPERLHPLWFTPLLPLLFLVSSIGMGLAAVIVVSHLAGRAFRTPPEAALLAGLARLSVWVWSLYGLLVAGHLAVAGQIPAVFALDRASVWFLLEIAGGVVAPILLFSSPRRRANPKALFATALLVIAGVALNRFNATLTAQRVPEGAGYAPHWMELMIQVGVLAAGVLAWYAAARFLPVLPGRPTSTQDVEGNRPPFVLPDPPAGDADCSSTSPAS